MRPMVRRWPQCLHALALVLAAVTSHALAQPVLIEPAGGEVPPWVAESSTVVRAAMVHVDRSVLESVDLAQRPALRLALFADVTLIAVLHAIERPLAGGPRVFHGTLRDVPGGTVLIGVSDDVMLASVWAPGVGSYELRMLPGGGHVVTEIEPRGYAPCDTGDDGDPPEPVPAGAAAAGCADDGTVIDMLVVYTPAARTGAGGVAAMETHIAMAAAATNLAYANSQISLVIQVVMTQEVVYTESNSSSTDLSRLTNPADGFMDGVHTWRDDAAADVVSLIVETLDSCGRANFSITAGNVPVPSIAFNVTKRSCAVGNLTFAHELGHNQGVRHDRGADNSDNGAFLYSHGYDPGSVFRTIMGVSNLGVPRVQHFSNPDVLYNGDPTGIEITEPNSAHNAMSISLTAFNVANFRCDQGVEPCPWDCAVERDGVVGTADLLSMLAQWGKSASSCDLDGGGVGTADLLDLLAHWGTCP